VPFTGSLDKMASKMAETQTKGKHFVSAMSEAGKLTLLAGGGAALAIGAESVKMAGTFQQNMSKLVTSGGETAAALNSDMSGVEKLMGQTGTSSAQLAKGLYVINSAGFHGADGLKILRAAAQGAKTENADLGSVTNGLTTLMNDYHMKASDAALVTSKMVTATSLGKTTFQDLSDSLSTVAPAANAVGLSMDQVLGAMATMTAKGTPAANAATYLRQTILQLSNPTSKAANEMAALGLSSIDVSKNLGARGLTGTFDLLTNAIQKKMGPSGTVLINSLKAAAAAGSGWESKLSQMTPAQQAQINTLATQGVAMDKYASQLTDLDPAQRTMVNNLASGTTNTVSFQRAFAAQSPAMQAHLKELASGAKAYQDYQAKVALLPSAYRSVLSGATASKEGFRDLTTTLAKLPPAQQTAVGALADMVGGTKSMQAALELTGESAQTFQANTAKIAKTSTEAGGNVAGWATVQKNFNQQVSQATQTVEALGIKIGLALIPKVELLAQDMMSVVNWFERHKGAAEALAGVIGGGLSLAVGVFTVNKIAGLVRGVGQAAKSMADLGKAGGNIIAKLLGIKGIDGAGKDASGALDGSAGKLGSANEGLTTAASKLSASADQIAAAAEKLASAGTKAGEDISAGGATAEADMAAGGATAGEEEAAGARGGGAGATGKAGGAAGLLKAVGGGSALVGGGLVAGGVISGAALVSGVYQGLNPSSIPEGAAKAAGLGWATPGDMGINGGEYGNYYGLAGAQNLTAILQNEGLVTGGAKSLTGAGLATKLKHYATGGVVRSQPGGQIVNVAEGGEDEIIGSGRTIAAALRQAVGKGSGDVTHQTIYQIAELHIEAQNPAELEQKLEQRARISALAGGSARSR
jgi:TP901 family phage tail tape measure protein